MKNYTDNCAVIILAAGLGTRMKSDKAKVLHEILGKPMVLYVVETASEVVNKEIILVIGYQANKVREIVSKKHEVLYAFQNEQLGTGHAVMCALKHVPGYIEHVVILCGDVPLITKDTLTKLIANHIELKRDITLLAVEIDNPSGYGRIILDQDDKVLKIVEEADTTDEQKKIKMINSGIYCVKRRKLNDLTGEIRSDNAQKEFYLTDIIEIGRGENCNIGIMAGNRPEEIVGVNNLDDLIIAENLMRRKLTKKS